MEKTPKAGDELRLLQAGMGRRTINVTEYADNLWVSCNTFNCSGHSHTY